MKHTKIQESVNHKETKQAMENAIEEVHSEDLEKYLKAIIINIFKD